MFYETNEINDILLCQQCQGRLEGPKILPCGETICSFCVSSIQTNLNVFNCLVCKQQHEMPKNELPDNIIALKLLSAKQTKIFRGEAYNILEKSLVEILKNYRLIKNNIENSNDIVKEHCIDLRSDVQLKTENVIQQINDLSSEIIEEIDEYEKKLIKFNTTNSKSLGEFNKIASELELFHTLNAKYLKQHTFDDQIVIKSNKKAAILIKKAELEIKNLNDIIFDGKLFVFEKNADKLNKSILGVAKVIKTRIDSIILLERNQIKDLITLCDFQAGKKWNLIYRASQDGFKAFNFHSKCDNKLNTFVIIKSELGNVFGGYTEQNWTPSDSFKTDKNFFVFSLINKHNKPLKLRSSDATKGISCRSNFGPSFGYGPAFRISDSSNENTESLSNLGITTNIFKHPYYADNLLEAQSFLAGTKNFKVLDIEAYTLE
jgi:hypothetical protein